MFNLSIYFRMSYFLGMVVCFLKGWFWHWRMVAWTANVYVLVALALTFFIPESPAWLVSKGRIEQALKSLEWINKYQPQPENKVGTSVHIYLHHVLIGFSIYTRCNFKWV